MLDCHFINEMYYIWSGMFPSEKCHCSDQKKFMLVHRDSDKKLFRIMGFIDSGGKTTGENQTL